HVGLPIFCAEGLSFEALQAAGVDPTPEVVCQEISATRFYTPNGKYLELTSADWTGYSIKRDAFDRVLSEKAVEAGAELMTGTKVTDVLDRDGVVFGVLARRGGEALRVEAGVVIGADGYGSTVRRTAGLGRLFPDFAICAQYRLGNLSLDEPGTNEFHFGSRVAPNAFAYVFPKSGEVANVGLGVRRIHGEPPIVHLRRFVESDPRFGEAEIQGVSGGIIPLSGVIDDVVADGVMLVGDAAGQVIPLTGAGVYTGVVAGRIAGEVAARAALEGEVSASRLSEYSRRFDAVWGKQIRDSRRVVEMMDRFSDDGLNRITEVLTSKEVFALANGIDINRVLAGAAMRSPLKFMRLMASYLRG
ncbi:MAG: NAD(P)/FAD-dependent oxidoreductase, partial [Candidatus Bathyarchaeia archaeon]